MNSPYEVLGIAPGASQQEIKKAYSRLLRTHTPETSPEEFIRIREAYDQLKTGGYNEDKPVFSSLRNERARGMQIEIETLARKSDWKNIIRICEKCMDAFPGEMFFLYYFTYAQRQLGCHGKAVNAAKRLADENPGNRWAMRELGFCLLGRGFQKKALGAMLEAYSLGARDYAFLEALLKLLEKDGRRKKMKKILDDMHLSNSFWQQDNLRQALYFYEAYIAIAQDEKIDAHDIVLSFCTLLETHFPDLEAERAAIEKILGKAMALPESTLSGDNLAEKLKELSIRWQEEDPEQEFLRLIGLK